jgi:transcription elongation GreA/GreB family factor
VGLRLTAADFAALVRELDLLRNRHRAEFARNLRDARTFGSPGEDDDVLTVFEEAVIDEARIAQLEEIVRTASVVDDSVVFDGLRVIEVTSRVTEGLPGTAKAA